MSFLDMMPLIPISGSDPISGRPGTSGGFSTASSTRRRRKKDQHVYSLEDVFNQVSSASTSNLNPPPGKLVLTPRSAEACLKLGVNPEILKVRDIDSFWEPGGMEPVVQRMRHEAYVQRRHDTMRQCRIERKRITNAIFEASRVVETTGEDTISPELILQKEKAQTSTLIQMEMNKIAKIQQRQEKELGQMIQYEISRTKVQEEMNQRQADSKRRDDQNKRQTEKRNRLAAEERRLKDLQKAAFSEVEEENRRALAKEMNGREKILADQRARKDQEQRRRIQEEDLERARRAEDHKAQVQKYFADEQSKLRGRLESMNFADRKKQEALLHKQREHAENVREKREKVEKRIEMNIRMADSVEEKRKNDFLDKQDHFERIRQAHLQQQDQDRMLHAQEIALQDQRRQMIIIQQRREEERAAQRLLGKFEDDEEHVQSVQEMRDRELNLHREKKSLRVQMKLENVERVLKQGEYRKSLTLKKIESCDSRIKKMLCQRQSLTEERRKAAAALRIQKENVSKVMDEVRSDASKANRIIAMAMTGKLPLQSIASGSMVLRGGSANNVKKKGLKSKRSKSLNHMVGMDDRDRTSKSAGEDPDYSFDEFHTTPPEEESPGIFITADEASRSAPLPYISPYEIPVMF